MQVSLAPPLWKKTAVLPTSAHSIGYFHTRSSTPLALRLWRMISVGCLHEREWQYPMEWAEVGKTAIFFHNGGASETFTGPYWYQCYAGGEWWNMSHGEPFLLRSFAGNRDKLAAAVTEIVAGRETVVPCMVD